VQAGRALDHGIDKERLKEALDTVRTDRSLGAGSKKGKTKSEVIPIDLDALMGKKS
jgi:hypothetical protein